MSFLLVIFRYSDESADTDVSKQYIKDFYFNDFPKENRFNNSESDTDCKEMSFLEAVKGHTIRCNIVTAEHFLPFFDEVFQEHKFLSIIFCFIAIKL